MNPKKDGLKSTYTAFRQWGLHTAGKSFVGIEGSECKQGWCLLLFLKKNC